MTSGQSSNENAGAAASAEIAETTGQAQQVSSTDATTQTYFFGDAFDD